mmetsp:Transcript_7718/g.19101  ORF Transcript_7718/g.19101 Transcript_7718/m.19101 type:complete len:104 (-) Transcript_7718:772-1083(-)
MQGLFLQRNVPVPLVYRQVVQLTVRGFLTCSFLASAVLTGADDFTPSLYVGVVTFMMELFLFGGWLKVTDAIANPFRNWRDGPEWEVYVLDSLEYTRKVTGLP